MHSEPVSNDPNNPLVSVLIYNYYGEHLAQCFDSILDQTVLNNIEVIYIDNASTDGSWNIALEYAQKYQGSITMKRNKRKEGIIDENQCLRMANGKYVVILFQDDAFSPEYVKQCVQTMESDPLASFVTVKQRIRDFPSRKNMKKTPLVSVLIHNYNYGRYLRQCLESVFTQTYDNIEICLSDNASTDDSWDIAVDYAHKYPGKMTLIRNRKNFGPHTNLSNCYSNINGKYFCVLCSDDAFMPAFVEQCVQALESHPDAGFAMTHRTIIDEHGTPTEEPPFYNQSCIIPGPEQASVYMMAAVNPSISQIMYNTTKATGTMPSESILTRWFAQRILDFRLCCEFSMAYIKDPLLIHRVHSSSDSVQVASSLVEIFGQYILPHQFAEIALAKNNMTEAIGRLPQALEKVGRLCMRYSVRALSAKDEECALRYFHLAVAILPGITDDPVFKKINDYWGAKAAEKSRIIKSLQATDNLTTRSVSYDPPPGWLPINGSL